MYGAVVHAEKTRSVKALVDKSTLNHILFIEQRRISLKRSFAVLDESKKEKYTIQKEYFTLGYPCINLYNANENRIGSVELTSKFIRNTYAMYHDGKLLGSFTRGKSVKIKFELSYNGWHLEGNTMSDSFTVTDQRGNVVLIFNRSFTSRDTYVLEINNRENEVLALLFFMAIEIILQGND